MTTERDPTSDPADVTPLPRGRTQQERAESTIGQRHRDDVGCIESSARSRLRSTIASLGTIEGWRRLPGEVRTAAAIVRRRRRERAATAPRDVWPRSSIAADSIFDEFSQRAFEHELTLRPIGRGRQPHRDDAAMLIAESAWVGNGGRWRHQFSHFEHGSELDGLIEQYRGLGVPTVFWNKEDPAHFETFLAVAGRFDHVFTTDADCVGRYRVELGHERVGTLPFAAQPALHNPVGRHVDPRSICFAGAWRGDVHPQRIEQLTTLLDAALEVGNLRIYARRPADGGADFPDRYGSANAGEIPYDDMVAEYRRHACFLNVNTVTGSPTMLSRRVFEILACRTPVVSAPSPALERLFGDAVPMPGSLDEATAILTELVDDPTRRDRLGQLGFRTVMSSHTYQHRVSVICDLLGIDGFPRPALPSVDAVLEVAAPDDIPRALATAEPVRPGLGAVVIVCRDGGDGAPPRIETRGDVHVVRAGSSYRSDELLGRLPGTGDFVAFLDAEAQYGAAAVSDAMLATRFADADVYGKSSSHAADANGVRAIGDGREFCRTSEVLEGTAIVRRSVLPDAPTMLAEHGSISRAAVAASVQRFAVDRFNHVAGPARTGAAGTAMHPLADVIF